MNNKYILFFAILFISLQTQATTYTSVANGTFSTSATWQGGVVPPSTITTGDTIMIAMGTQVSLDVDLTIDHPQAALVINGILKDHLNPQYISIKRAALYGGGSASSIDSLYINSSQSVDMTGTIGWYFYKVHADTLYLTGGNSLSANQNLHVSGPIVCDGGTKLEINKASSTIYMRGGSLSEGATGIVNTNGCGELIYTPGAANTTTGIELNGPKNITIDVQSGNTITLANNLTIDNGILKLTSGSFKLNNNNLSFKSSGDLNVTGGDLSSTATSDIIINTTNSLTGMLVFANGANSVKNLKIDLSNSSNTVTLGSNLLVAGTLDMTSGRLNVNTSDLTLVAGGTISNAGPFSYIIAESSGGLLQDVGNNQSKTFPVGNTNNYTPVIVTSQNGAVHNGIKINLLSGVRHFGNSGSYLSATQPCVSHTWHMQNTLSSNTDVQLELIWPSNFEVNGFNRNKSYISTLTGNYWDKYTPATALVKFASSYYIKRGGIKKDGYFAVFDENTVSVDDLTQGNTINIYPNPVTDVLYFSNVPEHSKVKVYSAIGLLVVDQKLEKNSINTSMLPSGNYVLMLINIDTYTQFRFVKH